ncbi:MAG: regulatory protein RecX [Thermoanaerobacteraceae bacterium]|nr:regulatory protein RecX [Thermoanaerobacteraceae bacterium]
MPDDKAMAAALRLLNYRWYTEKELKQKLQDKGYHQETVEKVVARLKELDYINDERYAEIWIQDRVKLKPVGRVRLLHELAEKGIERNLAEEKIGQMLTPEQEYLLALGIARKKLGRSRVRWDQLAAHLLRRGFPWEVIDRVGRELDIFKEK